MGSKPSRISNCQGSSPDPIATIVAPGIRIDPNYKYLNALPTRNVSAYQTGDAPPIWKFTGQLHISADSRDLLQPYLCEFLGDKNNPVGMRRSLHGGIVWIP